MRFDQPLDARKIVEDADKKFLWLVPYKGKKQYWRVLAPFRFYFDDAVPDNYIEVPAGFETDFASVPRVFWAIFPPDGIWTQAAVTHDFLYNRRGQYDLRKPALPRSRCDRVFLDAMKVLGAPLPTRRAMWRAVDSFGWVPWNFG